MKTINETIELVKKLHAGQFDKGGFAYSTHLIRVMERVEKYIHLVSVELQHATRLAALLHDSIEDEKITEEGLYELGYDKDTLTIINLVSRPENVTYMEFINIIINSGNIAAMVVKYADNEDNSDPDRIAQLPVENQSIANRYKRSMKKLSVALNIV